MVAVVAVNPAGPLQLNVGLEADELAVSVKVEPSQTVVAPVTVGGAVPVSHT